MQCPAVDRRRVVDIQKTLYIDAPLDQVYAFWSNYENFPLFMSHVREVQDLGEGRSRWSVSGPGGVPIEWHASLTQQTPNEVIAWRSESGSMLENAGIIRFSSEQQRNQSRSAILLSPAGRGRRSGSRRAARVGSQSQTERGPRPHEGVARGHYRESYPWQKISVVSSRP